MGTNKHPPQLPVSLTLLPRETRQTFNLPEMIVWCFPWTTTFHPRWRFCVHRKQPLISQLCCVSLRKTNISACCIHGKQTSTCPSFVRKTHTSPCSWKTNTNASYVYKTKDCHQGVSDGTVHVTSTFNFTCL